MTVTTLGSFGCAAWHSTHAPSLPCTPPPAVGCVELTVVWHFTQARDGTSARGLPPPADAAIDSCGAWQLPHAAWAATLVDARAETPVWQLVQATARLAPEGARVALAFASGFDAVFVYVLVLVFVLAFASCGAWHPMQPVCPRLGRFAEWQEVHARVSAFVARCGLWQVVHPSCGLDAAFA